MTCRQTIHKITKTGQTPKSILRPRSASIGHNRRVRFLSVSPQVPVQACNGNESKTKPTSPDSPDDSAQDPNQASDENGSKIQPTSPKSPELKVNKNDKNPKCYGPARHRTPLRPLPNLISISSNSNRPILPRGTTISMIMNRVKHTAEINGHFFIS